MKYKVGDRVRIKSVDWYNENKSKSHGTVACGDKYFEYDMKEWCGKTMTILEVYQTFYMMEEDWGKNSWTDEMIEGLVEEEVDLIPKFGEYSDNEPLDVPTMTIDFVKEHGLPCPDGYQFVDENGNVINATKIVLEKKEYPKTLEECCEVLDTGGYQIDYFVKPREVYEYEKALITKISVLYNLIICRDAYWKIAGEKMGLGKPWKPNWTAKDNHFYTIHTFNGEVECSATAHRNAILIFPTEEMRDEFYENFKELINECKELL